MKLFIIKCKILYAQCFQTLDCICRFFFIYEVYYRIVVTCTFLWQLLVASVSLMSCWCWLCFVAHVMLYLLGLLCRVVSAIMILTDFDNF